jgi:biopolymer transport protein ExbD
LTVARRRKPGLAVDTKVNVVPIINVSLVVVLTLMMIAPFLTGEEVDVDLPEASASQADDTDNIEIVYTRERRIIVEDSEMLLGDVAEVLAPVFQGLPHGVAVVKADQTLPYADVEALIAAVEQAGAPRIALATRPKEDGR